MALSANRNTKAKMQEALSTFKVKGSTHIYAGALVAVGSDGYLVPAANTSGLVVQGRADEEVNNTGSDGAAVCRVREGVYGWDNDTGSACTIADVGHAVYVVDDHTVGHSASNSIKAGTLVKIEDDGQCFVKTRLGGIA